MKRFKRLIRYLLLAVLIFLAALGMGIVGGVPINKIRFREENEKDKTELVEDIEEDEEVR